VLGAALAATLRGLNNDVYFQVALLTTIGLSSKNAILIVEFAEAPWLKGIPDPRRHARRPDASAPDHHDLAGVYRRGDAAGRGHRCRSQQPRGDRYRHHRRHAAATLLAIFFVPLFFVLVKRLFSGKHANRRS
jgi:multidrug efflux pump